MSVESVIAVISLCISSAMVIIGGVIKICGKIEKLSIQIANMVTREQCSELRRQCRWQSSGSHNFRKHK